MRLLEEQIAMIGTVPALRERCCSTPTSSAIGLIPVTMTGGGGYPPTSVRAATG